MPVLHHDIESYSLLNLPDVGAWRYSRDYSTGVWCCGYAVDGGPIKLWKPGDPVPEEFREAARNPKWQTAAHNDQFERYISLHIMQRMYDWPLIPFERRRCSQALALSLALPAKLELLADALGLEEGKDVEGERLMRLMAKPRKRKKRDPEDAPFWHDTPENRKRLGAYCIRDVAIERAVLQRLDGLIVEEQDLRVLDMQINDRGIRIDTELLENAIRIATQAEWVRDDELRELTDGALESVYQVEKLTEWLGTNGCLVSNLQKKTLKAALRRKDIPDAARRIIGMRLDTGAAARKLFTIRDWLDDDGRVRGCFRFHGGAPGRWTSLGIQIQNLKKPETDLSATIAAVNTGDFDLVQRQFGTPTTVVGDLGRAMIVSESGKRLFIGDYSGIESRVVAFLAGEQSKLDQWANFDRSGNPEDEPYFITGRHTFGFPAESARSSGKVGDLAFSYMGSVGAWRRFAPDDSASDEDIKDRRDVWRKAHPNIRQLWRKLENAAADAVLNPGKIFTAGRKLAFRYDKPYLRIRLPSGRKIAYPYPRVYTDTTHGSAYVVFKDNAGGKWVDYRGGQGAYGGTWIENATQAAARDLLAAAMQRIEAAGYPIVMHVHDEIVAEVADGVGNLAEFSRLLLEPPPWAVGLPLAAKVRETTRYSASDKPAASAEPAAPGISATERAQDAYISKEPALAGADAGGVGGDTDAGYDLGDRERRAHRGVGDGNAASDPLYRPDLAGVSVASGISPADGARVDDPPPGGAGVRPQPAAGPGLTPPPTPTPPPRQRKGPYPLDPHGDRGAKRGARVRSWVYERAKGKPYLKVDKHVILPSGAKRFYQHHWDGQEWIYGVKGTYAERKIPYLLPELIEALRGNPDLEVQLTEGEKDADTLVKHGYVATTNPGGALGWTDDITAWLRVIPVRRIAIHEDNDASGRQRTRKLTEALAPLAPSLTVRLVRYPDVPDGEDVTWWLDNGHTPEELEARIAAAQPVKRTGYDAVCIADVVERPLNWLWPGHLLCGALELLTGYPGVGKSQVQCQYVACATTTRTWPDRSPGTAPCSVIMLTAEDIIDQIIKPRLYVADADLSRVHVLIRIRTDKEKQRLFLLAEDLEELERMARDIGDVGLITIDPITAFMGGGGRFDSHKTTDVRFQLSPLSALAERLGVVVSAITHPAKSAGPKALDHYIGSQAFAAAARLGHLCIEERVEDEQGEKQPSGRGLFTQTRNQPIMKKSALAYRIEGRQYEARTGLIDTSTIVWEEEVPITADEAIAAAAPTGKKEKAANAVGFLLDVLLSAPVEVNKIRERGTARGFSVDQLNRAKTKLKIVAFKKEFQGPSFWALPQNAPPPDAREKGDGT